MDMPKRAPTNTSQLPPETNLLRALAMGSSEAILDQEAQGQQELADSDVLPVEITPVGAKAALEAAGVEFLGRVEDDALFQYVELPEGWQIKSTEHSMHSDLVDDTGRRRAGIFYKAEPYDRCASLCVFHRINLSFSFERLDNDDVAVHGVVDGDTVIHEFEPIAKEGNDEGFDACARSLKIAKAWLNEHWPKWRDPSAYWDLEIKPDVR